MKLLFTLVFLLVFNPVLAKEPFISESELVIFLNKHGYSIQTTDKQKISINYNHETDSWIIHVEALCQPKGCACIDCDSYISVYQKDGETKMAVAYDG